jgi:LmbE family N-acetylglucosaminyl deacetylase
MCVLAHPDDESLATGGVLAQCAAEGVDTYLLTATRGERGRFGDGTDVARARRGGPDARGGAPAARAELGLREVTVLGYPGRRARPGGPREATAPSRATCAVSGRTS